MKFDILTEVNMNNLPNHYDIIQQDVCIGGGGSKLNWTVIQGYRADGGYPKGYHGKDWMPIIKNMSYEDAKILANKLNSEG